MHPHILHDDVLGASRELLETTAAIAGESGRFRHRPSLRKPPRSPS